MNRCAACTGVLPDPTLARCPHCRVSLRRRPPVELAESRAGARRLTPLERRRREEREQAQAAEAQRFRKAATRSTRAAPAPATGPAELGEYFSGRGQEPARG